MKVRFNEPWLTIILTTIQNTEVSIMHLTDCPEIITMYTTEYCGDCLRAKTFFDKNNIEYIKIPLEGNEVATEFVTKLNNGYRSVPTIIFPDGSILVEPSNSELKEKINSLNLKTE